MDENEKRISESWRNWFMADAYKSEKRLRKLFGLLPSSPRCKFCNSPFEGVGAPLVKLAFGKERSTLNPNFCNTCDTRARQSHGGAEVEMSILFADIRNSTALSQTMSAGDFSKLINRFYVEATHVLVETDGLVDKLAGDSVAAFWGAGFAGPDYVRRTIEAARNLLRVTGHADSNGPWVPIGVGVHCGMAYFGAMGTADGLTDITAIGEEVNTGARLAAQARTGEIIISEKALSAAGINGDELETRNLSLKGISQPVAARVMKNTT